LPLLRDALLATALLGLLLLIAARLDGGSGDEDAGPETALAGPFHVLDGDTMASGRQRLRLLGLDAPELGQTCRTAAGTEWDCGLAARQALRDRVDAAGIECRGNARDRYHRLLVDCRRGEVSINGGMVRDGLAIASGGYAREEGEAKSAGQGIWAGTFESPRQWRAEHADDPSGSPLQDVWTWLGERTSAWMGDHLPSATP
jgi:endonuclease YncB( thermonuclease family)